jgi:RHS repeat-associated protein
VTRWERDASGELLKITNPVGATTVFEPGPLGILHARTGPDGVRHSFTYDSELNLVAVTYPTGATWTYTYDAVGQLVGETDFNGRTLNYEYDPAGRLAARTTGTGQRITLERDPVGRVIGRNTPEGGYAYRYDRQGRLTTASGPGTVLEYQRDPLGRVVTETVDDRTTRYAYDAVGRLVRRVTASGAESAWNYDDARRSVGLVAGAGGLELSFDAAGQEIRRSLGTDVVLRSQYDAAGRKISQRLMGGGAPDGPGQDVDPPSSSPTLLDRSWTWRADGVPEEVGDGLQGVRRIVSDLAGRPATISGRGWNQSFVYDSFGNRVAITDTSMTAPADAHVATGTLIRRTGRTSYEYDDAGRKVRAIRRTLDGRRKIWTYTWDSQDHLVSADTPDNGTWRYMYDPIGRRTGKHRLTDDGQTADETLFTWDGPCVAEQSTPAPDGTTKIVTWDYEPGTFRPAAQRSRDLDLGIGQDLIDAAFYAMVTDIVGAPTELVAADGRIVWQSTTDLWGRASDDATESAAYCPLRFPGQYLDSETGLHYNLHRYYDPETAAYLTPDPMGLAPSPNDHAYVPNPLIYIDPLGLVGCKGANAVNGAGPVKKGEDGVDMVEADLLADGHVVVGREVHVQMPGTIRGAKGSYRKFDLATIKDDTLIFHEVKNGPRAWYRHRQRDFDDTLMQVGGIPYGPKSGALADQYLSPEEFVINIMRI